MRLVGTVRHARIVCTLYTGVTGLHVRAKNFSTYRLRTLHRLWTFQHFVSQA